MKNYLFLQPLSDQENQGEYKFKIFKKPSPEFKTNLNNWPNESNSGTYSKYLKDYKDDENFEYLNYRSPIKFESI